MIEGSPKTFQKDIFFRGKQYTKNILFCFLQHVNHVLTFAYENHFSLKKKKSSQTNKNYLSPLVKTHFLETNKQKKQQEMGNPHTVDLSHLPMRDS